MSITVTCRWSQKTQSWQVYLLNSDIIKGFYEHVVLKDARCNSGTPDNHIVFGYWFKYADMNNAQTSLFTTRIFTHDTWIIPYAAQYVELNEESVTLYGLKDI